MARLWRGGGNRPTVGPVRLSRSRLLKVTVTAGAALLVTGAPAQADRVRADNGEFVNVTTSPTYGPNSPLKQRWANFMAHLEHGSELRKMTVYVAPLAEVFRICGRGNDGCYSSSPARLTLPGEGADPRYVELIAAHEYGHHLDSSRRNDPWDAGTWGPKYWATYENVCHRVRVGTAFPGDEGRHYSLNPDEAWAEAYAVLNGYQWESQSFDDSFKPDAGALRQMRLDIHDPWTGPRVLRFKGPRRHREARPSPSTAASSVKLRSTAAAPPTWPSTPWSTAAASCSSGPGTAAPPRGCASPSAASTRCRSGSGAAAARAATG